ncbi:MAG: DNA-formamidopyrimidine glycosylase family protein, partial [Acidimicrobiia bacterium]
MPELPDIVIYLEALAARVLERNLVGVRVASPAVLRTYDPPYTAPQGQPVVGLRRIGKRIVLEFPDQLFVVMHLMIAGRLQWKPSLAPIPQKVGLAAFDFDNGTLLLTEQGTKKRAGIWVLAGEEALAAESRGGVEPLEATPEVFSNALLAENRTLKRALTDPRILSGIGNSYSDEIL